MNKKLKDTNDELDRSRVEYDRMKKDKDAT